MSLKEPKNVAALRKWVNTNRPDIAPMFDRYIKEDAFILLMTIGFEAGRMFQAENPDMALNQPILYMNP